MQIQNKSLKQKSGVKYQPHTLKQRTKKLKKHE